MPSETARGAVTLRTCASPGRSRGSRALWADRLATGGRVEDIREAHAACEALLAARPDPPDSAWTSLAVTRDQFAALITRMVERKRIKEDGTVELMRWRHPGPRARRLRPMRFVGP